MVRDFVCFTHDGHVKNQNIVQSGVARKKKKQTNKKTLLWCWTWQDKLTKASQRDWSNRDESTFSAVILTNPDSLNFIIILSNVKKNYFWLLEGQFMVFPFLPVAIHIYTNSPWHWPWYSDSINLWNQTQGHLGLYLINNVMRISGINNMQNAFNPFGHADHCMWCSAPNPSISF